MAGKIDARLVELGIELPDAPAPAANYVPYVIVGEMVYISGQVAKDASGFITGKLGDSASVEDGAAAARVCGLSLIAQLREACGGDLDRVKKIVKLGGFVNATPDFENHPTVVNGASDLMVEVFGDIGEHARAAVGCNSLPFNVSVEIEGIFQISA